LLLVYNFTISIFIISDVGLLCVTPPHLFFCLFVNLRDFYFCVICLLFQGVLKRVLSFFVLILATRSTKISSSFQRKVHHSQGKAKGTSREEQGYVLPDPL